MNEQLVSPIRQKNVMKVDNTSSSIAFTADVHLFLGFLDSLHNEESCTDCVYLSLCLNVSTAVSDYLKA
jgi:hypothetical protein